MVQPLPKHRAREYETIFIVHPDTNADGIDQIAGRLTDTIGRLEGKLVKAENWGRRRLAYPIRKQQKGIYIYLRYIGYSDMVHELERNMRMLEPVIKYITVKLDEDVDPQARPVREEDISFVPQFEEEPSYSDGPSRVDEIRADSMDAPHVPDDEDEEDTTDEDGSDSEEEDMRSPEESFQDDPEKDVSDDEEE
jgi:small subunit ribosomal protein S6